MALDLRLPLQIKAGSESVAIFDAAGTIAGYVYLCDEPERRRLMKRVSREQAVEIARVTARALTVAVENSDAR